LQTYQTGFLARVLRRTLEGAVYAIRRSGEILSHDSPIRHAFIFPEATYSPWLSDSEFNHVYQAVRNNTMVNRYRCYELWQLVGEVAKLPGGDLLEVGVWRGGTGGIIACRARSTGVENPIYLCDTFKGVVKAGALDTAYKGGEHADTSKETVMRASLASGYWRAFFPKNVGGSSKTAPSVSVIST